VSTPARESAASPAFRLGADQVYRCEALADFPWQEHGFGTRSGAPPVDVTLRQIHSNRVSNAHGLRDREREGDALITDDVGLRIGVRTADCVPILVLDHRTRAVAAIHAGWRGTAAEIVRHAIEEMRRDFGGARNDVYAAIGPCIRACCYEVGVEVWSKFPEYRSQSGRYTVDLAAANRAQMEQSGVPAQQIFDCGLCAACMRDEFFSYRREPENPGRMMSAIVRTS